MNNLGKHLGSQNKHLITCLNKTKPQKERAKKPKPNRKRVPASNGACVRKLHNSWVVRCGCLEARNQSHNAMVVQKGSITGFGGGFGCGQA